MRNESFKSMFKPIFIGLFSFTLFLCLLTSLGSLFGFGEVKLNGEVVTGWKAFVTPLIMAPILSFVLALGIAFWAKLGLAIVSVFKRK